MRTQRTSTVLLSFCFAVLFAGIVGFAAGESTLVDAAKRHDATAVRGLIGKRANVNETSRDGSTALLWAAYHSDVAMTRALITAGANPNLANKYGIIYMNTNSSAPSEAGENCSRVKFVWDGNGTNFSKAAVANAVEKIGKRWLLLTNDYVWGHTTSAATKAQVEAAGGQIIDNLLVPQNTRDFTSYLLKVQQAKPDVVAIVHGETSTGRMQPLADIGRACREADALLVVDAVATIGGVPVETDA